MDTTIQKLELERDLAIERVKMLFNESNRKKDYEEFISLMNEVISLKTKIYDLKLIFINFCYEKEITQYDPIREYIFKAALTALNCLIYEAELEAKSDGKLAWSCPSCKKLNSSSKEECVWCGCRRYWTNNRCNEEIEFIKEERRKIMGNDKMNKFV